MWVNYSVVIKWISIVLHLLKSPALHLNFGTEVRDVRGPLHRIAVNVQLELVGLVYGPSVSVDTIVNVILLVEYLGIQVNGHLLRGVGKVAILKDMLQDKRLADFHAHYHLLTAEYVSLKVQN